jgi:SAM-dependent methyltransferase
VTARPVASRSLAWTEYLERFHGRRAGITADTLSTAHDAGIDPYTWALEPLGSADRLVDLACGDGPVFARWGGDHWIGVDTSRAELARARAQGAPGLIRADVTRLPLADAVTPAVMCSMALMIVQPLERALTEIRRILTDGGLAVVLMPGGWPLSVGDLWCYTRLMFSARRTHLAYPNDGPLVRLRRAAAVAGLEVTEDRRRRFVLPLPDAEAAERFVSSLYLPGIEPRSYRRAVAEAQGWAPGAIGVPLRRVVLQARAGGRGLR